MAASKKQTVYRDVRNGKGTFVTKEYADKHPNYTVKETNKRGK